MQLFDPSVLPFVIFFLRAMNNAVGTMRVLAMNRGRRVLGFALASIESLMFAYTAGMVLTDLENIPNLVAYVLGFAVGGYVGMYLEQQYLNAFSIVDIIAPSEKAHEIALALREAGHGVTEMHGEGARGRVCQLRVVTHRRDVRDCIRAARAIKPDVFVTVEESTFIANGWVRSQRQQAS